MRKYLILMALAGFIICLDQATKLFIHSQFMHGEHYEIINNFFRFTYVKNFGAAFGFLANANETLRTVFFMSVPPIAAIAILFLLRGTPKNDMPQIISLSSIFAGAIGNYIDRLRYGYVVDFLDFHFYERASWPAFNVADMSIVMGICLMLFLEVRRTQSEKKLATTT